MRIILMGQQAFGETVLKRLQEMGEDVVAVVTPPDGEGGRSDPLTTTARGAGLNLLQPSRMAEPGFHRSLEGLDAELVVMAFVTDIVPERVLRLPRLGTIQYHPSLLPKHRGGSAINWPIIAGEVKTGVTIFWPDAGIDTGPILLQREVNIAPDDTVGSLYFDKLFPLGVDALVEAVELVRRGEAPCLPQDESQATYEGLCGDEDAVIDWSRPASELYNLVRGTDPQPGATARYGEAPLKLYDASLRSEASDQPPGTVLHVGEEGLQIAVSGGSLLCRRVRGSDGAKVPAARYVQATGLRLGDRLG